MALKSKRMMAREAGDILTAQDVADRLQLSERTVVRHFTSGVIPGIKIGVVWRCPRPLFEKFLAGEWKADQAA